MSEIRKAENKAMEEQDAPEQECADRSEARKPSYEQKFMDGLEKK